MTVWEMSIGGLVSNPGIIDIAEYLDLDHRSLTFDIHCVTSWTRFDSTFTGVPLHEMVSPLPEANYLIFDSYSSRGHHTSLPVDYAMEHSWVVHELDGEPLGLEHGGPVRVVTPGKYFYKSIKWLRSVEALAEDRLGWWETNSSYHNNADPSTGDERFTTGSMRPEQVDRFKSALNLDKYRGRVMIGLDLTDWSPSGSDLRRLYLKNCDLREVDLSGRDMRACNLSLSDLRGANLAGTDLSGSDLEGADFSGANLREADLSDSALSATRFDDADVTGALFDAVTGLLESQASYLVSRGVSLG
ncbi:MAG TPA: molybdopterin-dependent oxidoreductase [Acidimicrobiia bacterium]|nr:molybdopterin-dependent oxidoreductase [Acidimicrobiia bacterium]